MKKSYLAIGYSYSLKHDHPETTPSPTFEKKVLNELAMELRFVTSFPPSCPIPHSPIYAYTHTNQDIISILSIIRINKLEDSY